MTIPIRLTPSDNPFDTIALDVEKHEDNPFDSIGKPTPAASDALGSIRSRAPHIATDETPGPFAEDNAKAFIQAPQLGANMPVKSTKLERATTATRDASVTRATAPAPFVHHEDPLLGTIAKIGAAPFENPGGFIAGNAAAIPEAIAKLGAPSPNGRDEQFRYGTDEPLQTTSDAAPVSGKEKAIAAAQLVSSIMAPDVAKTVSGVADPFIGAGPAALAGGVTAGALPGAAFMPEHPVIGGIMGGLLGGAHAVGSYDLPPRPMTGEANLADHPDRLIGHRAPPPRASVKLDLAPEAPSGSPFDVDMNTIDEALGRKPTPAAAPASTPAVAPAAAPPAASAPLPAELERIAQHHIQVFTPGMDDVTDQAVSQSVINALPAEQKKAVQLRIKAIRAERQEAAQQGTPAKPSLVEQLKAAAGAAPTAEPSEDIAAQIEQLRRENEALRAKTSAKAKKPKVPPVTAAAAPAAPAAPTAKPSLIEQLKQAAAPAEAIAGNPFDTIADEPATKHDYSSTQIDLPEQTAAAIHAHAASIPDEHLASDGRENTPHITVKYGLHGDNVDAVRQLLSNEPPIRATLGKTSLFKNDDAHVLKVDVDSPDLHRLNAKIASLPHTDTHPDYKPHATIAYLKPGQGDQYAGNPAFEGHALEVNHVAFSDRNGNVTHIPLTGTRPLERPDVPAAKGRDTVIRFGNGEKLAGHYAWMPEESIVGSHHPTTFAVNPELPEGIQNRAYHGERGRAARQQIASQQTNPDFDALYDAGSSVESGPTVVTPQGIGVAGFGRDMTERGVSAEKRPALLEARRAAARTVGIPDAAIAANPNGRLVRVLTDPRINTRDAQALGALNRSSDMPSMKAKDSTSEGASRAAALMRAPEALNHFATTIDPDDTINDYLGSAGGTAFTRELIASGVIGKQEVGRFIDGRSGAVTNDGREIIRNMMYAAAVPNADVLDQAPKSAKQKLEHAIPSIVVANLTPKYELGPVIERALSVLTSARTNGMTLEGFLAQGDLTGQAPDAGTLRMARFLDTSPKAAVSDAFRKYATLAKEAGESMSSIDAFGFQPETREQLAAKLFRPHTGTTGVHERTPAYDSGSGRREEGVPRDAHVISSYQYSKEAHKGHEDFAAAKAGDVDAAVRYVEAQVDQKTVTDAAEHFGRDAVYVAPVAIERTGTNAIPQTLAAYYAASTGARVDRNIVQANRAFHTGANAMERLVAPVQFFGRVERGARYVLVDDVVTSGSTMASLADYIQSKGGRVTGVVSLADASRSGQLHPPARVVTQLERRFGDVIRQEFGIEPSALTAEEAQYLIGFRTADELRARAAAAREARAERQSGSGVQPPASERPHQVNEAAPRYSSAAPDDRPGDPYATSKDSAVRGRFYSRLARAIDGAPFQKGTGKQWAAALAKDVAKGEREWTGLEDFLKSHPDEVLTKHRVRTLFNESRVELVDVENSDTAHDSPPITWNGPHPDGSGGQLWQAHVPGMNRTVSIELIRSNGAYRVTPASIAGSSVYHSLDRAKQEAEYVLGNLWRAEGHRRPRYRQYTEPGSTNYREIIVRTPPNPLLAGKRAAADARVSKANEAHDQYFERQYAKRDAGELTGNWTPEETTEITRLEREMNDAQRALDALPAPDDYMSSHWDQIPNSLLHLRLSDRTAANGDKVLFVEEAQSDRHQEGRDKGYRSEVDDNGGPFAIRPGIMPGSKGGEAFEVYNQRTGQTSGFFPTRERAELNVRNANEYYNEGRRQAAVPDAPMKKTEEWLGFAMKRVIDEAVRGGYDRVMWTTGEQQARRYDLSKQVDRLIYDPASGKLVALKNRAVVHQGTYDEKALPSVVGKEIASKLLASPTQQKPFEVGVDHDAYNLPQLHVLDGDDLKVGGHGMKTFYDEMMPAWVKNYAKKLGVDVEVGASPLAYKRRRLDAADVRKIARHYGGDLGDVLGAVAERMEFRELSADQALDALQDEYFSDDSIAEAREVLDRESGSGAGAHQPGFRVTPELRDVVNTKGQAMWERRRKADPAQYDFSLFDRDGKQVDLATLPPEEDAHSKLTRLEAQHLVDAVKDAGLPPSGQRRAEMQAAAKMGLIDPVGRSMRDKQESAEIMRAFRHPAMEILHAFIKDDEGQVLAHTMSTSGILNWSAIPRRWEHEIEMLARKVGGTTVTLGHNHPSGDPVPSPMDVQVTHEFTILLRKRGLRLDGHVVINHDKASWISKDKEFGHMSWAPVTLAPQSAPWRTAIEGGFPQASGAIAMSNYLAKVTAPEGLTIAFVDSQHRIIAVSPILEKAVASIHEWLPEMQQAHAARAMIIAGRSSLAYELAERIDRAQRSNGKEHEWAYPVMDVIGYRYKADGAPFSPKSYANELVNVRELDTPDDHQDRTVQLHPGRSASDQARDSLAADANRRRDHAGGEAGGVSETRRVGEPDLFGNDDESDLKQGSLFAGREGAAESRNLQATERAARNELERLRQQRALAKAPADLARIARRMAELERLLNRDHGISAEEMRTRAAAGENTDLFGEPPRSADDQDDMFGSVAEHSPDYEVDGPERIKSPAIRLKNGRIIEAPHHLLAWEHAGFPDGENPEEADGFTTTHGRFVGRDEAYDIADRSDQLSNGARLFADKFGPGELHATDIDPGVTRRKISENTPRSGYDNAIATWWESKPESWRRQFIARNNEVYADQPHSIGLAGESYDRLPATLRERVGVARMRDLAGGYELPSVGPDPRVVRAHDRATSSARHSLGQFRDALDGVSDHLDNVEQGLNDDASYAEAKARGQGLTDDEELEWAVRHGEMTEAEADRTKAFRDYSEWRRGFKPRVRGDDVPTFDEWLVDEIGYVGAKKLLGHEPQDRALNGDAPSTPSAEHPTGRPPLKLMEPLPPGYGTPKGTDPNAPIGSAASFSLDHDHETPAPAGLEHERSKLRPREFIRSIRALFNPESLGLEARGTAGTVRHVGAVGFRELTIAQEALKDFGKAVGKLSRKDAVAYWNAAERGQTTGNPTFDAGNRALYEVTQHFTDRLIKLDRLKAQATAEHYLGRFWDRGGKSPVDFLRRAKGKRPLEGPKSFLKSRTWEYFTDGLDAIAAAKQRIKDGAPLEGDEITAKMRPATYNYVDSQLAKIAEMQRVINAELMLRAEKKLGRAKIVMNGADVPVDSDGDAWQPIGPEDDPAFTVYGPKSGAVKLPEGANINIGEQRQFDGSEAQPRVITPGDVQVLGRRIMGRWYAPKNSWAIWRNHLAKGIIGNPIVDAYMAPAQASAQIMLGLSGFHATTIATEGMFSDLALATDRLANTDGQGITGVGKGAVKAVLAPSAVARLAMLGRKVMQEYRAPGTHPEFAEVLDAMLKGGFRGTAKSEFWTGDRLDQFKKNFAQAFEDESKGGRLWGAAKLPASAVFAGLEVVSSPLMAKYVPLMKTGATYELAARELAKLPPNASLDDARKVMTDVVKEMDYRFGQVVYDNHFIHPVIKHIAQMLFLAPGWTFGTQVLAGRGIRDVARIPDRAVRQAKRRFAGQEVPEGTPEPLIGKSAAYWLGAVAGTMLINGILTYLYTKEHPHGKDYFAFRDGTVDGDGNPNRHTLPGYVMHDVYGYGTHGATLLKNKLSPTLAFMARVISNRDYFGDMLYDDQAPIGTKAKQLGTAAVDELATPLSVQNYREGKQRGEHSVGDMALNTFGVTPAKREFVRTPAQNLMADLLGRRGHDARTPAQADSAKGRADVFRELKEGTRTRSDIIQLEREGELSKQQGQSMLRRARTSALVGRFQQLSLDEAEKVFALGNDEERELWWKPLQHKRGEAHRARARGKGER